MLRRPLALLTLSLLAACSSSSPSASPDAGDAAIGATDATDAPACGTQLPADTLGAQRAACTFGAGASSADTLGVPTDLGKQLPIRHVVVLMKENRAFDNLLHDLHALQPDVEAVPASFANLDASGASVAPFHATSTCVPNDPGHQWDEMHAGVDGGAMDGFVKSAASSTGTDGHFVMGYYEQGDLPFYYWLASTFALDDHHFASLRSGTYPNRDFLMLGTNDGVKETGVYYPDPTTPTLFDALDKAGLTWGVYSDGQLLSGALDWSSGHPGTGTMAQFLSSLDAGTLPAVAFVDGIDNFEDDHPPADVQRGEAWLRNVYEHAIKSPEWGQLALVWTYDEGGGFADHVPPPNHACVARPGNPKDTPYFELGPRVPLTVISPWAKPHYVSHVVEEHTAITRFIETIFGLPALTARDANSTALLDLFDFGACTPPMLTPPDAPAAGTGGCN